MKAKYFFRTASIFFVLFAAGHTYGFLNFRPPTPEALAVYRSMQDVSFRVGSANFSYGGFYQGFGLYITVYLLFSAVLAWQLGAQDRRMQSMGWTLFVVQLTGAALSWKYFGAGPLIFSTIVAVCLGCGAYLLGSMEPNQARKTS